MALTPEEKARREAQLAKSPQQVLAEAQAIKSINPDATALDQASGTYNNEIKRTTAVAEPETSDIDKLMELQREQQLAALEQARTASLSALDTEQSQTEALAKTGRTDVKTQGQRSARNFGEYLATRGLSTSGTSDAAQIAQAATTQQGVSDLYAQEQSQLADIESRRTLAEQEFALGQQSLESQLAQQALQYQMTQKDEADALALQNEAQAKEDYLTTISRFSQDYQAEIDKVRNDGDPTNDWQIPYLQTARQNKISTLNLDPTTGQPLPTTVALTPSQAMQLWSTTGRASQEIVDALGSGVILNDPYSTYASRQVSSGGGYSSPTTTTPVGDLASYSDFVNQALQSTRVQTPQGLSVTMSPTEAATQAIASLIANGQISTTDAIQLSREYNVNHADAVNMANQMTQPTQQAPISADSISSGIENLRNQSTAYDDISGKNVFNQALFISNVDSWLDQFEQYVSVDPTFAQEVYNVLLSAGLNPSDFYDMTPVR